jgi:hypothetical protein
MIQIIIAIRHSFANAPNHDDDVDVDDSYAIKIIILSSIVLLIIS